MPCTADPFADANIARPTRNVRLTGDALTARAEHAARLRRRRLVAFANTSESTRSLMRAPQSSKGA